VKARIINITQDNFHLIPCPAESDYNCQNCFYWIGKRDAKFDLTEQKKRWLAKRILKYGNLAKVYLIGKNETPAGFIQFGPIQEFATTSIFYKDNKIPKKGWCIPCIMVDKTFRGRGIAKELITAVLKDLKKEKIESVDVYPAKKIKNFDKEPAGTIRLWQGFGFEKIFERKKDRAFQDDRLVMRLKLG
jgi:ribosomal protein S18 acetylase RimI-like enzyme